MGSSIKVFYGHEKGIHDASITTNPYGCIVDIYPNGTVPNEIYTSDSLLSSNVTITKYQPGPNTNSDVGSILSGTFNITLLSHTTNDTIRLTNGRFDIKKQQ